MKILYENARIYFANDSGKSSFLEGWLLTDGERIARVGFGSFAGEVAFGDDVQKNDLEGARLAPGLIDVHTHGRVGGDFNTADGNMLAKMSRSYLESGVTSVMPTLASATLGELYSAIGKIANAQRIGADNFIGIHLEGRYLNKKRRGAHASHLLAPLNADEIADLVDKMNAVGHSHVSAALELDENGRFVRAAKERGATVGLAHTDASFMEAQAAFERGAVSLTHAYNGMSPFRHREVGAIGAGLLNENVYCEIIADGFHVSAEAVKLAYRLKGDKLVLITDSMEATCMPDGEYSIAGLSVTVNGGQARTHEGAIAGSTLSLIDGVKNLARFADVSFESALYNATVAPAKMLGIFNEVGSLEAGKTANMLVLDEETNVREVIFKGNSVKVTSF